ncbi:ferric reductase-like transmembrane domain-containing protein, partial [Patescibacteria group bacterium]|nr:ferric reductase-like transmembrane domain-containing protein [Patescibacteria group bacterium]
MNLTDILYNLGKISGLITLISLALLVFSGDTARYFDRFFGLDRLIKFQRKFSFFVLAFTLLHPALFILSGRESLKVFIPNPYLMPLNFGIFAFLILIIVMLFSHFYKRISYRAWQYIHILTYILLFFALYHAFFWGSSAGKPIFQIIYLIILIAVILGAFYRFFYKFKTWRRPKFYISKIIKETNNIFSISLRSDKKMQFKAGQFCFLRLKGKKLYARHPFTISSSPGEDELLFTVKNTGRFTFALSKMNVGDEVLVDGPFGRFTERKKSGDLVFIAGGVGITPFRSMALDFLTRGRQGKISLIYCGKYKEDLVFENDFNRLQGENFKALYVLSGEKEGTSLYFSGRINKEIIEVARLNMDKPTFYICGPGPLKVATIKMLKELGVSKKKIVFEDFFW